MKLKRIDRPSMVKSHLKIKEEHPLDKPKHDELQSVLEKNNPANISRQERLAPGGLVSAKSEKRPSIHRLADGGKISAISESRPSIRARLDDEEEIENLHANEDEPLSVDEYIATHEGSDDDLESDRLDRIMSKRYADGGQVDLDDNAIEHGNDEDDLSHEALLKENYSEADALDDLDQPEDSNEHGDQEEQNQEDEHDRVDRILRKRSRRG